MIQGFWEFLNKPFFVLAPMADVTDAAFRRLIAKYGKPDVMWTEFVSCDGLCSVGRDKLLKDLWYTEGERPIVAQFFGGKAENFYESAKLAQELGFDGIDINMGCPDRNVEKQGAGAALIKDPERAQEIIFATKEGAGDLPVSVKTRIGYATNEIETWIPNLLKTEPVAITIHARTRKEMSSVPARWDVVASAVKIRNEYCSPDKRTLIIGNGDVVGLEDAKARIDASEVDGVMIGRGIFGNPWCFDRETKAIGLEQRLKVMCEHAEIFEELFETTKAFHIMKKHFKAYVQGFKGAKELRGELMETQNSREVISIVEEFLDKQH